MLTKLLILCILSSSCLAEDPLLQLDDSNFDDELVEYETALVFFFAPWCGHCKKLKPEFAKAAEEVAKRDKSVAFVTVDCTEAGKETCDKHGVEGYPTLKIFKYGERLKDYDGPRDSAGLVDYIETFSGPDSKDIQSVSEMEKFLTTRKDVCVMGFFKEESKLKNAFLDLAQNLKDKIKFAHSTIKSVLKKQDIEDGVVLFRPPSLSSKFEEDRVVFTGNPKVEDLDDFVKKNYRGLVGYRKTDNREFFGNPSVIAYYNVDYVKNAKGTNYWRNRLLKIAKQYKDQVTIAISSKTEFQSDISDFDLPLYEVNQPVIVAHNAKDEKFLMEGPFSVEALEKFIKDFLDGKLEAFVKSEPIPITNDGPVKIAVAKNFDQVVVNNGKDTMVAFYAPWCSHCQKLAPRYEEFAKLLKDEDLVFVKMDATANEIPKNYTVDNYPTLYWVSREDKWNPVMYKGKRKFEDLIKFVAEHASEGLKGFDKEGKPKMKDEL